MKIGRSDHVTRSMGHCTAMVITNPHGYRTPAITHYVLEPRFLCVYPRSEHQESVRWISTTGEITLNIKLLNEDTTEEDTHACTFEVIHSDGDGAGTYVAKVWMNRNNGKPWSTIVRDSSTGEIVSEEKEEEIVDEILRRWLQLTSY
jgi:hypothetical protein